MPDHESRSDLANDVGPHDVLQFWMGPPGSNQLVNAAKWYAKDEAFDRAIAARFGGTIERAARGALDAWKATPRGRLALVIVLDQFPRNVFRGTPRAFAQDAMACTLARECLAAGDEAALTTVERSFLYLPLMHAEDIALQRECVAAFERLHASAPAELVAFAANGLDYAKRHAAIVERFGHFPHRNQILDRTSTEEELAFLTQPGSSF